MKILSAENVHNIFLQYTDLPVYRHISTVQ